MTQLIETKVEGKELVRPPNAETMPVVNLMDALKASVAQVQRAAGSGAPSKKKVAKSKKKVAPINQSKSRKVLADQLAAPKTKAKRKKKSG